MILQVEMTTRAELAFNVLDTDKTGYITIRQLKMISKKLSSNDVKALMIKVFKNIMQHNTNRTANDKSIFKIYILCEVIY
jgi:Ca2+-binding EF-hand superfamily protein